MPEGPEVQTVIEDLCVILPIHPIITDISLFEERSFCFQNISKLEKVINTEIISISRLGKFINWKLDNGYNILFHLSFTGKFSTKADLNRVCKFTINNDLSLFFTSRRGLSKVWILTDEDLRNKEAIKTLGLDGLMASPEDIYNRLHLLSKKSKQQLKPFLLDFKHIAGIGNIYGSEICFNAKLKPTRTINTLSDKELHNLAHSIHFILNEALKYRGSTIEDFSSLGEKGNYQKFHTVYKKEFCSICKSKIKVIEQNSRKTFYCDVCQE